MYVSDQRMSQVSLLPLMVMPHMGGLWYRRRRNWGSPDPFVEGAGAKPHFAKLRLSACWLSVIFRGS